MMNTSNTLKKFLAMAVLVSSATAFAQTSNPSPLTPPASQGGEPAQVNEAPAPTERAPDSAKHHKKRGHKKAKKKHHKN